MAQFQKRIPVGVIGGFLGAGKTTLVNHLVASGSQKFGIIVNEFGETGIDGSLIENVDTDGIAELSNGCLCCVGREDLISALFKLISRKDKPDYILIELSGLADPVPVAQTVLDPFARTRFELDSIIGVADARNLEQTLRDGPEGAVQLAYANAVVLNKTDLASPEQVDEAEALIRKINPLAQVFRTAQSRVNPQDLLHLRAFDLDWRPQNYQHLHMPNVQSFTLSAEGLLERPKVNKFIDQYLISRPDAVFRAKGFLSVKGFDKQVLFQSVREIFSLELSQEPLQARSRLVVIGRGLNQFEYEEAFQALKARL
ncbi:CobW family GTP-binding protein [Meiothermus taiwanensis]|jgi:G3E family GTPase|uniref:Cobalamin synthesis protein P47K n=2 Tax=Meiothermus taiwanensis TaxID=172827 RepID=A0ABM6WHI8_9DEIN|nr:GTP-binding protein [Meiothermus taiwanensis]AWR86432.1 cobalamin synthesis protein P47K [Meiothermus taiwanensis WR-220]KIQ55055.1 cobalamin biosynthesis protein CobW [Meiothermus taiwanensis]KZK15628.1 cobalamin biosynthesis protein CobW [Meiothermus taiwanensis]RIH78305.1 putative metal chaperone YciC [Meiothermus taiwanensis]